MRKIIPLLLCAALGACTSSKEQAPEVCPAQYAAPESSEAEVIEEVAEEVIEEVAMQMSTMPEVRYYVISEA